MKAIRMWPLPRWLSIVLFVFAIVFAILYAEMSVGPTRYSSPSMSIWESRRRGVFVKQAAVTQVVTNETDTRYQIQEAWIEFVNERYDMIPVVRGRYGVRLCVSFAHFEDSFDVCGEIVETTPSVNVDNLQRSFSGNLVVYVFWAKERDEFPIQGVFTFHKCNLRSREQILATFEFKLGEHTPTK